MKHHPVKTVDKEDYNDVVQELQNFIRILVTHHRKGGLKKAINWKKNGLQAIYDMNFLMNDAYAMQYDDNDRMWSNFLKDEKVSTYVKVKTFLESWERCNPKQKIDGLGDALLGIRG